MDVRHVQALLASANYYRGAIDGDAGPKTMAAVEITEANAGVEGLDWAKPRRLIAAAQRVLNAKGFEAGVVDGYAGHNTNEALTEWLDARSGHGPTGGIDRDDPAPTVAEAWPLQRDMEAFYGKAGGPQCTAGKVVLPMPFVIAWNTSQSVSRFSCHEKVAGAFTAIFNEAHAHYGSTAMASLKLNSFGGCYNFRKMRGGRSLSTHAYGIAVDLNPTENQLRWNSSRARMARSEYEPFWKIVEAHGGVSLGRERDFDWMHFQFARLS